MLGWAQLCPETSAHVDRTKKEFCKNANIKDTKIRLLKAIPLFLGKIEKTHAFDVIEHGSLFLGCPGTKVCKPNS